MTRKQARIGAAAVVTAALVLWWLVAVVPAALGEPAPRRPVPNSVPAFALQGEVVEVIAVPLGPDELTVSRGGHAVVVSCPEPGQCPLDLLGALVRVTGEAIRTPTGWVRVAGSVDVLR